MPEISVIIPVYDVESTIHVCVDSVLKQTFSDYEIILVDDGSPDNCGRICDEYKAQHNNITVIHKENGGLSDARNAGLTAARGTYVMFLDSDDYITEDCLDSLLQKPADMIIGFVIKHRFQKAAKLKCEKADKFYHEDFGEKLPPLVESGLLDYIHAKLYNRQVITEHNLSFEDGELTYSEDTYFNYTFLKFCQSVCIVDKYLHHYTYNSNGLGRRFYPDRYEKTARLDQFLVTVSKEMGIYNENMIHELSRHKVRCSMMSLYWFPNAKSLGNKVLMPFLNSIYSDRELREALSIVGAENLDQQYDNLLYRLRYGPRMFVARYHIKRMLRRPDLIMDYLKEVMCRLHILKRK